MYIFIFLILFSYYFVHIIFFSPGSKFIPMFILGSVRWGRETRVFFIHHISSVLKRGKIEKVRTQIQDAVRQSSNSFLCSSAGFFKQQSKIWEWAEISVWCGGRGRRWAGLASHFKVHTLHARALGHVNQCGTCTRICLESYLRYCMANNLLIEFYALFLERL